MNCSCLKLMFPRVRSAQRCLTPSVGGEESLVDFPDLKLDINNEFVCEWSREGEVVFSQTPLLQNGSRDPKPSLRINTDAQTRT